MPDFEKQIAAWRQELIAAGIKEPMRLDELEGHLREEIEKQMQSHCTEQQALEIAVQKFGSVPALKAEFAKNTRVRQAKLRGRAQAAWITTYGSCAVVLAGIVCKNELTASERISGFASVCVMLLFTWLANEAVRRYAPVIANKKMQSAVAVVGSLSGMAWSMAFTELILPRLNLMPGQLFVTILWAMIPMLVLPVAAFTFADKSEQAQLQIEG